MCFQFPGVSVPPPARVAVASPARTASVSPPSPPMLAATPRTPSAANVSVYRLDINNTVDNITHGMPVICFIWLTTSVL